MLPSYNNSLWCLDVPLPASPSKHILLGDIREWVAAPACGTFESNWVSWQALIKLTLAGFYLCKPRQFCLTGGFSLFGFLLVFRIYLQTSFSIHPLHFPHFHLRNTTATWFWFSQIAAGERVGQRVWACPGRYDGRRKEDAATNRMCGGVNTECRHMWDWCVRASEREGSHCQPSEQDKKKKITGR